MRSKRSDRSDHGPAMEVLEARLLLDGAGPCCAVCITPDSDISLVEELAEEREEEATTTGGLEETHQALQAASAAGELELDPNLVEGLQFQTIATGAPDENWTASGAGFAVAADTTNYRVGNQGLQISWDGSGSGTDGYAMLEAMVPEDPVPTEPTQAVGIWLYPHEASKVKKIKVVLYTAGNKTTYISGGLPGDQLSALSDDTWSYVRFNTGGTSDQSSWPNGIHALWIEVDFYTGPTSLTVGEVCLEKPEKAKVLIVADGCYQSFYDIAYQDFKALGIPVTWACNPTRMGGKTTKWTITTATLREVAAENNNDISFHSWDRTDMGGFTPEEVYMDTLKSVRWIEANINPYVPDSLMPWPVWRAAWTSNNCPNHWAAQGIVPMYATPDNNAGSLPWPPMDLWNISRVGIITPAYSVIDTIMTKLQQAHGMYVLYYHGVSDDLMDIPQDEHDYFVSRIADAMDAGWLECVTMPQLLAPHIASPPPPGPRLDIVDPFVDCAIERQDGIVTGESLAGGEDILATIDGQADVPRNIRASLIDPDGSVIKMRVRIRGIDAHGNLAMAEFYWPGPAVQHSDVAFAKITEVKVTEVTGGGPGDYLEIGSGSKLGLFNPIGHPDDVYKITLNGQEKAFNALGVVDPVFGTVDVSGLGSGPGGIIADGDDFVIHYKLIAPWAIAGDPPMDQPFPISSSPYMHLEQTVSAEGIIGSHDVDIQDGIAYAVSYWSDSITSVNLDSGEVLDTLTDDVVLDGAHDIVVDGDYAYIAVAGPEGGTQGLTIVDISDPYNLSIADSYSDEIRTRLAHALSKMGDYVYIGAYARDYLTVFDVSDPTDIILTGSVQHALYLLGARGTWAMENAAGRKYVFVAARASGYITAVDVTDPAAPFIVHQLDLFTPAAGYTTRVVYCEGVGNYLYVTNAVNRRLEVVDISEFVSGAPAPQLSLVTNLTLPSRPNYLRPNPTGKLLYISFHDIDAVACVDISDPANPRILSTMSNNAANDLDWPAGLRVYENKLVVTPRDGDAYHGNTKILAVIDLSGQTERYVNQFRDSLPEMQNGIVTLESLAGGGDIIATIDGQPDVPRSLVVKLCDPDESTETMRVFVSGLDAQGKPATEEFYWPGPVGQYSDVAFSQVTEVLIADVVGAQAGDWLEIGPGSKLGLSTGLYSAQDVYKITLNRQDKAFNASQVVDPVHSTVDVRGLGSGPGGIIADGDDFAIYYKSRTVIEVSLGDMDGSGAINTDDIEPFVLALTDGVAYAAQYGVDGDVVGDIDRSGKLDADDINLFVQLLAGGATATSTSEPPSPVAAAESTTENLSASTIADYPHVLAGGLAGDSGGIHAARSRGRDVRNGTPAATGAGPAAELPPVELPNAGRQSPIGWPADEGAGAIAATASAPGRSSFRPAQAGLQEPLAVSSLDVFDELAGLNIHLRLPI